MYNKWCKECGCSYISEARTKQYCPSCAAKRHADAVHKGSMKRSQKPGVGKGGNPIRGSDHAWYKNGYYTYETLRRHIRAERKHCERCAEDVSSAGQYEWVVHHRDHNHFNNVLDNLELLCKRCHQVEHECWKAFEGVTTISQESTDKRLEAPDNLT